VTRLKQELETALFLAVEWLARRLPEAAAFRLGESFGAAAGALLRGRRRVVLCNLRLAFPESSAAWRAGIARASWRHLGRELVSALRLSRASEEELRRRTDFVGMELLRDARAKGKGVILFTAHLGSWEVGTAGFVTRGIPFDAVVKPLRNPRLDAVLAGVRARIGWGVIDAERAVREVPRALRRGRVVAVPSDQNPARGGALVPFFGEDAPTPLGAATFAARLGVPALFGYALRAGDSYVVHVESLGHAVEPTDLLASYHAALERAIRRVPEQYFWQHRRWKPRPPEHLRSLGSNGRTPSADRQGREPVPTSPV